jgi:hypothetical protein
MHTEVCRLVEGLHSSIVLLTSVVHVPEAGRNGNSIVLVYLCKLIGYISGEGYSIQDNCGLAEPITVVYSEFQVACQRES